MNSQTIGQTMWRARSSPIHGGRLFGFPMVRLSRPPGPAMTAIQERE